MPHENSISQVVSNYLLDLIEEQYQILYSPDNPRQPGIGEEEYEAPLVEEGFYTQESDPESEPESEPESRPIQVNRERRILTRHEQQTINTNYNNLQTEIELLEVELFGSQEDAGALIDGNGRDIRDEEALNGYMNFPVFDEGIEVTLSPTLSINNVDNLLQTSSYMDINALGPDDLKCVICCSEYSKESENNTTEPAVEEPNQDFPGQKTAECPLKLPCDHVFGYLCIRRWLRISRSPTCPICRYELQPDSQ